MKKITKPDLIKWYDALPSAMKNKVYLSKRFRNGNFIVCAGIQKINQETIIGVVSNNVFNWFETVENCSFTVFKMKVFMHVETQYSILRKKPR